MNWANVGKWWPDPLIKKARSWAYYLPVYIRTFIPTNVLWMTHLSEYFLLLCIITSSAVIKISPFLPMNWRCGMIESESKRGLKFKFIIKFKTILLFCNLLYNIFCSFQPVLLCLFECFPLPLSPFFILNCACVSKFRSAVLNLKSVLNCVTTQRRLLPVVNERSCHLTTQCWTENSFITHKWISTDIE